MTTADLRLVTPAPAHPDPIGPGCSVRLRSGGPVMKVDIHTPEQYMGDFVGDLQKRRATIARTDVRGTSALIEAHAPLAELFGYSSAMRSLSQGRAGCSIEPLQYAPAPPSVAEGFGM